MPYGITQCYLTPGRGDIPALTPAEAGTRLSEYNLLVDCGSVSGFMFDCMCFCCFQHTKYIKKAKSSPYSITERRVPELTPVLGSQPAGDVSHKSGGRLPLLSLIHI